MNALAAVTAAAIWAASGGSWGCASAFGVVVSSSSTPTHPSSGPLSPTDAGEVTGWGVVAGGVGFWF